MASRKEQKERLRRERQERERQAKEAERRRRMIGYGAGGALVLAAVVAVVIVLVSGGGGGAEATSELLPGGGKAPAAQVTDLKTSAKAAGCELTSFPASSRDHTEKLSDKVKYKSNPPTAGKHYFDPAADGAYSEAPPDVRLVHTQEHGRVVIWFKPSLPKADRADLKALFDEDSYQMVLVPRAKMPYAVAATAWGSSPTPLGTGYVMGCKRLTPKIFDALRTFRDEHRGKGPEPVP